MGLGSVFRRFDSYGKVEQEFRRQTVTGGLISVISYSLIAFLVVAEIQSFLTVEHETILEVDTSREKSMDIYINLDFPSLPCCVLSLDATDSFGKHQVNIQRNIMKSRLDKNGFVLGQEPLEGSTGRRLMAVDEDSSVDNDDDEGPVQYTPKTDEEKALLKRYEEEKDEGCSVSGFLTVSKVPGNFHFSLHASDVSLLEAMFGDLKNVNVSHVIHQLHFGPEVLDLKNSLDGERQIVHKGTGIFNYNLKVVPTVHHFLLGEAGTPRTTNQYSVAEEYQPMEDITYLPAVFFNYDISPIMVNLKPKTLSLSHFLTHLCAIVGGIYTVSTFIESFVHSGVSVFKKDQMGKLT